MKGKAANRSKAKGALKDLKPKKTVKGGITVQVSLHQCAPGTRIDFCGRVRAYNSGFFILSFFIGRGFCAVDQ